MAKEVSIKGNLKKISDCEYLIDKSLREGARVNSKVIATGKIIEAAEEDALAQLTNVACLPGIVEPVCGMPDIHWGYGLPMGAVGAFDSKEGVISCGCTGFDINCLSGDSEVLTEFGCRKRISDFESTFGRERIKCVNPSHCVKNTDIRYFMKKVPEKTFRVRTEGGKEITATADHPFLTKSGMVPLKDLEAGGEVSCYPFEGVAYVEPKNGIILKEDAIGERQKRDILKSKGLLPLRYSDKRLGYLLKIFGFVLGEGCMDERRVGFYGDNEDLEDIRKDVVRLGFKPSKIYSREREHEINTAYGKVEFERTEHCFYVNSRSLAALLEELGMPKGNKTKQEYLVPGWIFECELWQKRLFLAALFGAELTSPKTVTNHGYNFYGQILTMNKEQSLLENGKEFLNQIRNLLGEFGVESNLINERKEYESEGYVSYRLRLQISAKPENLIRLWSRVGYEYNRKRSFLANVSVQYLKAKGNIVEERKRAIREIDERGLCKKDAIEQYESSAVNRRFIERTLYEGRKTEPRIAFNIDKFEEFLASHTEGLGETGQVWDRIDSIEESEYRDMVYDFTVEDEHHNFIANNFVVSNCGIRMIKTNLTYNNVKPKIQKLIDVLFKNVPSGVGAKGKLRLTNDQLSEVLVKGAKWAVEKNYCPEKDLQHMEEYGCMEGADVDKVSDLAMKRGLPQLGTLGAGNHFLEVQRVGDIFDEDTAKTFGVTGADQIIIMLHCGSRGFGHQVATDYLKIHDKAAKKYGIKLPDPQLVCAPVTSDEGQAYFGAMKCAVNYAFANRTIMTSWVRDSFEEVFLKDWEEMEMDLIYDVCHNICKLEEHKVNGKTVPLYVHRKGSTRSLPAGHELIPETYRKVGQPVLIAGSMGTASYILVGGENAASTFYSSCHGAGRVMSRNEAIRRYRGRQVQDELFKEGIVAKSTSPIVLAEESPNAYKDVDEVIKAVDMAGISRKVVRVVPVGVVKG
ncbi:MAG: intein-containing RctB family protein [Candidatus Aenigmatarchaeota archaeon]